VLLVTTLCAALSASKGWADIYGWWKLNDGSGDVAMDSGPRAEHGEIFDGEWVDDPTRGTVLSLDGQGAWVDAGFLPLMDLENDFTWAFWAYQGEFQATPANDIVLGNRWGEFGTSDTSPREFIKFTPNRFEYHMNGGFANDLQYDDCGCPERHIPGEEWIHHTVVKDGDMLTYYRNGEFGNDHQLVDPMFSPDPLPFAMGGQHAAETWEGLLSDVRLYDQALTAEEVKTIMAGGDLGTVLLKAGDADQDLDFDQLDLVKVQVGGKYLTGQAATWGQGDWNGAPGGQPGSPPPGDNRFDQLDIIAALGANTYLKGPYAALANANGVRGDGQTSIVYNAGTGEVAVDAPAGTQLTSVNIDSAGRIFTGAPAQNLGGSFDNDADGNIFKATFGSSFGSLSFGNVAQAGLSQAFVLGDLTVVGSLAGGGALGNVDLIYIPEPSAGLLAVLAALGGVLAGWRRRLLSQ
jgi:hypothetical protein